MTQSEEFERVAAPLRAELAAYCYRMVGSADVVVFMDRGLFAAFRLPRTLHAHAGVLAGVPA